MDSLKARYIASLELDQEPERYELFSDGKWRFEPTRREVLARLGAGVLFVFTAPVPARASAAAQDALSTRFHVSTTNVVTLLTGKVELGQGARTLLTRAAAEELRLPPERVLITMGDTGLVPDDGGTWASLTTPQTFPAVRRAAAALRELFIDTAAKLWGVPRETVRIEGGAFVSGPHRRDFGQMAELRAVMSEIPAGAPLTPPSEWRLLGQPAGQSDGWFCVTGEKKFTADYPSAGMLHGAVVRPRAHTAKLLEADSGEAGQMPGVRIIREGDFLGVTAPDPATARRAARSIKAKWDETPLPDFTAMLEGFRKGAKPPVPPKPGVRYPALVTKGDAAAALAGAPLRHESTYSLRPIAHAALEPRAAIAEWSKVNGQDFLTVRGGSQAPFAVKLELAEAFRLAPERVRVIAADCGGAFGGKQRGEVFLEAARLARDAGKPVRLVWSREEEFTVAYSRPAAVIDVKSGFNQQGKLLAWEFHNYNSGAAGLPMHYNVEASWCGFHAAPAPLRQGSYRSLAAVANTFARESHMEEVAARLELDPLEFRLRNTGDARLREVMERAASLGGWAGRRGKALGFAANIEKDARLALCVEAVVDPAAKTARLVRAVMVFDPGAVLNPDHLKNQIEGAIVQGLGGALFEEIRWEGAAFVSRRLTSYRVPRFQDAPKVEVHLIDRRTVEPAGAGESPITVVAPAIASAIFHATGKRLRSLPLERAWRELPA